MNTAKLTSAKLTSMEFQVGVPRVEKRPEPATFPEIGENDHACDGCVGTPERGEGIALDHHYNQENRQVCRAEDYHRPYFREKQRTAGCSHIQQRNRVCVLGVLVAFVDFSVPGDVNIAIFYCLAIALCVWTRSLAWVNTFACAGDIWKICLPGARIRDMLHCSDGHPYAERSYITIDIRLHE